MKIITFNQIEGNVKMILKCDSSLLVNRKPFFIPEWSNDIQLTPCVVLRVSRMGKYVGLRFARRYYDAVAIGVNLFAADYAKQNDWTRAFAFDGSLPMGGWIEVEENPYSDLVINMDAAIVEASKIMTIRQGDLIVINRNILPRSVVKEEIITLQQADKELLYCKIK